MQMSDSRLQIPSGPRLELRSLGPLEVVAGDRKTQEARRARSSRALRSPLPAKLREWRDARAAQDERRESHQQERDPERSRRPDPRIGPVKTVDPARRCGFDNDGRSTDSAP